MIQQARLRRSFLFLQGPHGSFFPKLGASLAAGGHFVRHINLNGGDRATWPGGDDFHGRERGWRRYVGRYVERWNITDVVLFGDSRPQHVVAIREAKARGLRVHVFEEGYIRPDWVTLERDGVNGHSLLSREMDWYRREAIGLRPLPAFTPVPSYSTARGWAAFFYYAEAVLQHWRFPFYGSHRDRDPVWEGITYLRRFRRRDEEHARDRQALADLAGTAYFLFPLQLNSDYQIRVHSRFGSMRAAISAVLDSFAAHAPARVGLLVKEHPLDSGLNDWRRTVGTMARDRGIAERVTFVEHGDLLQLVGGSSGMVTVNSTSGTVALAAGRPVKVLGDAVYDVPGITAQEPLDAFWAKPSPPDLRNWDAFYRVLAERCLIHGAFLSNVGIDRLVAVATDRMTEIDRADVVPPTRPRFS